MQPRPPFLDPALADLSDAEVQRRDADCRNDILAMPERAAEIYRGDAKVQPELAWRSRTRADRATKLLFITVGAQAATPTHAGLAWRADHVVLLHTEQEREPAQRTLDNLAPTGAVVSIVEIGDGYDLVRLYRAIERKWTELGRPEGAVIDMTGGFKTMSAAAAAAGFAIPGCRVVYLNTDQERPKGQPEPPRTFWFNTRVIELEDPLTVFGVIERQRAADLL